MGEKSKHFTWFFLLCIISGCFIFIELDQLNQFGRLEFIPAAASERNICPQEILPKSDEELLLCSNEPQSKVIFKNPPPNKPFDGCFVSSIFGVSVDHSDKPIDVSDLHEDYPNYAFLMYTNLIDLKPKGWQKVLFFDGRLKRMITQSRYPKFMAWKDSFIQDNCPVVYYFDGICSPYASLEDFQEQTQVIHQSPTGLAQKVHPWWNFTQELKMILRFNKDLPSNIELTRKWLQDQPDFVWNCTLYRNIFFGTTNKNWQSTMGR